jgi:exodeoxyribonuclease V alpha subunit
MLRSKSELIIYQLMLKKGIKPMYEKRITIKDVVILPDYIIDNDDTGVTYYWEHCGMMHDPEYIERWSKKLAFYRENEILPYQEGGGRNGTLIVTEEKLKVLENGQVRGAFSVQEIEDIIDKVLLG